MTNENTQPCPSTEELNAYLETRDPSSPIAKHVAICPRCRRIVEIYLLMDECVDEQMEPPKDLMKKIIRVCEDDGRKKTPIKANNILLLILGLGAILILIVIIILMASFTN